jgi:hypothetical protein
VLFAVVKSQRLSANFILLKGLCHDMNIFVKDFTVTTCGLEISCRHVQLRRFFLHPMRGGLWRKWTNDGEGNYKAVAEQLLDLGMVFIEANKVSICIFLFDQDSLKIKNQRRMDKKYRLYFIDL